MAGLLFQTPHRFFAEQAETLGFTLPEPGAYAAGMTFLPHSSSDREACKKIVQQYVEAEGQTLLGWRDVPRNSDALGWLAREGEPVIEQVFIKRGAGLDTDAFERKLMVIRKQIERSSGNMSDAAARLGLHRSNLYRKMRQLGMQSDE